ncbi:uncharacterized protein LOC132925513 [Rhopalosiphum padi]|uniref:uncharacterized protein LOC132925513 n=1 Tax=Rhopalosiphum padi TaxID=40932 RepID=UPI00298E5A35|nr:uncharacterized protein LOC132925513 [Rhopalosiphum padi]
MNNPHTTFNLDNPGYEPRVVHGPLHGTHYRCTQQIPSFLSNVPPSEVFPEIENPSRQVPESALLTINKKYLLLSLLAQWNMKFLYNTLAEALVDVDALQFISPEQCESLLTCYPLGIRIKFTAQVTQLQRECTRASQFDQRVLAPMFANMYL